MTQPESPTPQETPAPEAGPEPSAALSRRRFLTAGAGTAAALLLAGPAAAQDHDHGGMIPRPPVLSPRELARHKQLAAAYYEPFSEPPSLFSRNGGLDVTLHVVEVPYAIPEPGGPRNETVRTYNGQVPGPTLKVQAGDTMKIHMSNELPANSDPNCPPHDHHAPHCFNTTNLHLHGLHISPQSPSDNVFLEIPPLAEDPIRGKFDFCFVLPDFHKPGTHWYHAHKHGSTAIQLENGLAGALIVDDPPNQSPQPSGARDVVFLIQEIVGVQAVNIYNCASNGDPLPSVSFNVNGKYQPSLSLRAGEVQRWRFINATGTPRGVTPLSIIGVNATGPGSNTVPPPTMRLIAVDGIYLPAPRDVTQWTLWPGNRADFLVQFPAPGTFYVNKGTFPLPRAPLPAQNLVVVTATAPTLSMTLPTTTPPLPPYLTPITESEKSSAGAPDRIVTFDVTGASNCAGKFRVDNIPFDPMDPPIQVQLGATELWEVRNNSNAQHPFHIHINPFMVVNLNGTPIAPADRYWQDTVAIPANGFVRFTTRFQNFPGRFVLHCHILVHEDWGMMRAIEVVGNGYGPCQKVSQPIPTPPSPTT
ncbi:MAG: hypothetical protein QOJ16_2379 [Acidobacteriota bacterium]|nr:hypothetical protein [Acidobacteriota bacterium]